ncbi:MAG: hypothetical protein GVY27_01745, partial [Deinococcus-Thermus bacterium]|nr:hypothetical protein [Deinococcota bacterium]
HIWQWQNRAETGYHPLKAAAEHTASDDPYLFDPDTQTRLLDHPFEQQAVIVEEYVCCAALDPEAPRTEALLRLVRQPFPEAAARARVSREAVRLPWRGAETRGICR